MPLARPLAGALATLALLAPAAAPSLLLDMDQVSLPRYTRCAVRPALLLPHGRHAERAVRGDRRRLRSRRLHDRAAAGGRLPGRAARDAARARRALVGRAPGAGLRRHAGDRRPDPGLYAASLFDFLVPADGNYAVGVTGTFDHDFTGAHIEAGPYKLMISVFPVPEAASLAVGGAALAVLGALGRVRSA
jgi:hypothetical protein